jgi:hypothetical protein
MQEPFIGQFGIDAGHEFEVVEKRGCEVKIRYCSDDRTAWFQENRFGGRNELELF